MNRGFARAGLIDELQAFRLEHGATRKSAATDVPKDTGGEDDSTLAKLLQAYDQAADQPSDARLHARIAEALRVYVRDERLSIARNAREVSGLVDLTIRSFDRAEQALAKQPKRDALHAWVLAHRAAAYTTKYFLSLPSAPRAWLDEHKAKLGNETAFSAFEQKCRACQEPDAEAFKLAERDLKDAINEYSNLPAEDRMGLGWTKRFLAFLYALRGQPATPLRPSDYHFAIEELKAVQNSSGAEQGALKRSIAMLLSFDAVDRGDDGGLKQRSLSETLDASETRRAAIEGCIEAADEALAQDPEDFIASYFGAVGNWLASLGTNSESSKADVTPAISSARIRSRNAISQANATLLGLDVVEAMQAKLDNDLELSKKLVISAKRRIEDLLQNKDQYLDLETQAVFFRDPVWFTLANDARFADISRELWRVQELRCRFRLDDAPAA